MEQREAGRLLCDLLSGRTIPQAGLEALSPADWESLADWALRYRVGALLYRETKSTYFPAGLIPVDVRNTFRDAYRNLAGINTRLFSDASTVLRSLADNHLPVIALKGLSLAHRIYGDIALRPMSDIDLLVKEEDLVRAGRILLTLGYRQNYPAWESMVKTFHNLPQFTNKRGTIIELHSNIVKPDGPIRVDLDGLWERACLVKVDHAEVRALSLEDQFVYLCIHACLHLQAGLVNLIPLCDIAGLIKTSADAIDWQIVMERAARWGGHKCVYLMLLLIRDLLGAAPPDMMMSTMKPDDYQPVFLDEALEQILNLSLPDCRIGTKIGKLSEIGKVKGTTGKVLALLKVAFPSREYVASEYPVSVGSPKIYLCYLFRMGRLMARYTPVLVRLFRRDPSAVKAAHRADRVGAVSDWMFSP